jgi:hypothetical protein
MEVSCRLPVCVISSVSFTDWFNVSRQETWGFDLPFRKGDHKAVMRRDLPRLEKPVADAKNGEFFSYYTILINNRAS